MSIITPSLNQREFLAATIASVAEQDHPALEHIVIDGGSSDGSVALLKEWSARVPGLRWISEPDRGQSDAINKGIRLANGDIIGWLNSDDVYSPRAVTSAVHAFASDPDLVMVYGNVLLLDRDGRSLREFEFIEDFDRGRLLRVGNFVPQPAAFVRREALLAVGGLNASLCWTMDWDLWIRVSRVGGVRRIRSVLGGTREYGQTKTLTGGWRRYREIVVLLRANGVPWRAPVYRRYLFSWAYGAVMRWLPSVLARRLRLVRGRLLGNASRLA